MDLICYNTVIQDCKEGVPVKLFVNVLCWILVCLLLAAGVSTWLSNGWWNCLLWILASLLGWLIEVITRRDKRKIEDTNYVIRYTDILLEQGRGAAQNFRSKIPDDTRARITGALEAADYLAACAHQAEKISAA
jgi:hypothetical protein